MTRITKPMMDRSNTPPGGGMLVDLAYEYRKTIGNRIRNLRIEKGLTQRELGDLIDLTPTGLSALELGRSSVSPERYAHLADVFKLSRTDWGKWLLRYTDPYLYALMFGDTDPKLREDLNALDARPRVNRPHGPRH